MALDREDYTDEPPRWRDEYGDEPPRRRDEYDDYGYRPDVRRGELSGLDAFFTNNFALAVVLAVCCNLIGLVLGIVGLATCKDPVAKKNAMVVTIVGAVVFVLVTIGNVVANFGMRR